MQLFANNAQSKLASPISNVALSLQVTAGEGSKFPSPTGGDYFLLTLAKFSGGIESDYEIVKVTARSGDTMTIVRAQEGTTAKAYAAEDRAELRLTGGALANHETHTAATGNPHGTTKTDLGLGNVDNTSDLNKPISTATQTALNAKAPLASPTFTGTVSGITKAMVGLGNVDNTTDASKPVSTAQQAALDLKAPLASPAFTGVPTVPTATLGTNTVQAASTAFVSEAIANLLGTAPAALDTLNELAAALGNDPSFATTVTDALALKAPLASPTFTGTVSGITKAMVGLGSVDNTSDLSKPISTATQTALDGKQALDADLTAIAALAGTAGLLRKTAANTWSLDTATYLTGITSSQVTTALGFTPYNATNPNGYITSSGSITGNAATATALATPRLINGQSFDGTANITVADATKLPLSGGTMTGVITFAASQTFPNSGITYSKKTAAYTAVNRDGVIADTTAGPWTLTLPATPSAGHMVFLADGGSWATNSLTVARNGSTIEGVAEDLVLNVGGAQVQLLFDGTTWQVYAQVGGAGGTAVTLSGSETLTNKDLSSSTNIFPATFTSKTLASSTLSGTTAGTDGLLTRVMLQDTGWDWHDNGTSGAFNYSNGSMQRWAPTAASNPTMTLSNWPPANALGELLLEVEALNTAGSVNYPTIKWMKSDGTFVASPSLAGITFQGTGLTDFILLWTRDGGTTVYAKVLR